MIPEAVEMRELLRGLREPQKCVDSKYFYDQRGSELFDEITTLPEYYLTRAELGLLREHARDLIDALRPQTLFELGAGSARKTRLLLGPLEELVIGASYVPLDVSHTFLAETARELRSEFPELRVTPIAGDFTRPLPGSIDAGRPALAALLGSTLGNFSDDRATEILGNVATWMRDGDHLLLGVDMRPGRGKTTEELESAYDDARGVTAEFNLNLLRVLNDRFGANFPLEQFEHVARYDATLGRIEMHLRARSEIAVDFPDEPPIRFSAGETVRTEISCKYDRPTVEKLMSFVGLTLVRWIEDDGRYALALGVRRG